MATPATRSLVTLNFTNQYSSSWTPRPCGKSDLRTTFWKSWPSISLTNKASQPERQIAALPSPSHTLRNSDSAWCSCKVIPLSSIPPPKPSSTLPVPAPPKYLYKQRLKDSLSRCQSLKSRSRTSASTMVLAVPSRSTQRLPSWRSQTFLLALEVLLSGSCCFTGASLVCLTSLRKRRSFWLSWTSWRSKNSTRIWWWSPMMIDMLFTSA